jgi:hypothetical protein
MGEVEKERHEGNRGYKGEGEIGRNRGERTQRERQQNGQ